MNIWLLIKYIILGIVQGFTEPLPISSSGHLVLIQELFGIGIADLNFEIIVNAGSLIAIIIIFYKDIFELIKKSWYYLIKRQEVYKQDFFYVLALLIAVIPAGIIGFLFKSEIETVLKSITVVAVGLIITSVALWFVHKQATNNVETKITFKKAVIIGLFQVVALIPGISRSGSTMVGGLSQKIKFEDTMKFSFILYIPISLATIVLGIFDLQSSEVFVLGYVAAFIVSIITTFFAIKWFFKMVRKGNLLYFSYYCATVGILVLLYQLIW